MNDNLSKHINDAKLALNQRRLNHAIDSLIAATELLAADSIPPLEGKQILLEETPAPAPAPAPEPVEVPTDAPIAEPTATAEDDKEDEEKTAPHARAKRKPAAKPE